MVDFDWGGLRFRIVNVYAPADVAGRRELFGGLDAVFCTNRIILFGGDFNVSVDRAGDSSVKHLKTLLSNFSLKDAFRSCSPVDPGFTWRNSRGSRSRIDCVFVAREHSVLKAELFPAWFTDHLMLSVKMDFAAMVLGRGYWKMNINILFEDDFKHGFVELYRGGRG